MLSELERCRKLYSERTQIASCHNLVLYALGFVLGDEFRSCDASLGAGLVEEVHYGAAQCEAFVHLPVHSAEGLPVAVEVVCLVDVGVCLAEVAEACPQLYVLRYHIARVEFDKYLGYLCHDVARSIDVAGISVIEGH